MKGALIAVAALATLGAAAHAQRPMFRGEVEEIRVDVLVTRDGRPVDGLTPADFQVLDNGVVQQINHSAFEELPLNVVLALDGSYSVTGDRAAHLRSASRSLLDHLKPIDQAALVTFGDAILVRSPLTQDIARVRQALDQPLPRGDTALLDAAQAAILVGESQPGRALVLVFSDGIEVSSYLDAEAVSQTIRRSSSVIYGVTPQKTLRPRVLDEVATSSGGSVLEIRSSSDIDAAFARVIDEFRHRYLLSYTPQGVTRGGWHRLEVRVKQRGVEVKARPGYEG
jgi:VWFA-related protein